MREINISAVIAAKRREKGITQDELAEYIGVTKASVSKWETAQSYPDITLLPRLASYFHISIDELIGYLPQMPHDDITKTYNRLSHDFSCKPFDAVYAECQAIIKKYYACFPLLQQMAVLLINHYMLPQEKEKQEETLNTIISLCEHIKTECHDIWLAKQANSIEALSYLVLQKPLDVLELLDGTLQPISGDEVILSNAYQMKGNTDKAKAVLQVSIYQYVITLLGLAPSYLMLHTEDKRKAEMILERYLAISKAFEIEKLRPDLLVQLYYVAALVYAGQKESEKTLEMLMAYTLTCTADSFFIRIQEGFHADDFFDSIGEWFEKFDIYKKLPRDKKLVKEDILKVIRDNPSFVFLVEDPKYQKIIKTLEGSLNQ